MSRRRRSSNPISLFSFQDIITSVTGIMILVTLLMALDLSQRVLDSPRVRTIVVNDQLEAVVSDAEEEIRQLESELAAHDTALQQIAAYDRRRLAAESNDVKHQIEQLEAETSKLASQANKAQTRQAEIEARSQEKEGDAKLVEELSRKIVAIESKIQKLKATNRIIYNPAQGASKAAWLVELTDRSVRVAPMGRASQPVVFAEKSPAQTLRAFDRWAQGRDHDSEYFVLLIKPSGIDLFDQLREKLADAGFEIGFDVVDDQATVIDAQTGAGA